MRYDPCHASKDFLREAGLLIDSLIYSETRAQENKGYPSAFSAFLAQLLPILKAGAEMSECFLFLSSYEPLIAIAEKTITELEGWESRFKKTKEQHDIHDANENEAELFVRSSKSIMERLLDDLASTEISERLCCDYLRYMICLLESMIRLCGCALVYEKCDDILLLIRNTEASCRALVHSMKSLLSLIK